MAGSRWRRGCPWDPDQAAGRACVWCGESEPTIGLGSRLTTHLGAVNTWAPRACTACAAGEAARVLAIHVTSCDRCCVRGGCADARALRQLAGSRYRPERRPGW